jgi:hypothetical protein
MRAFQSAYIGRHDFPKYLPEFMLPQWFTLSARDRHLIRKTFRSRYWIGAALQLGFTGMTGTTLGSLEYVPNSVLHHVNSNTATGDSAVGSGNKTGDAPTRCGPSRENDALIGKRTTMADVSDSSIMTTSLRKRLHMKPVNRSVINGH